MLLLRQGDHIRARMVIEQSLAHSGDEETLAHARAALAAFETNLAMKQDADRRRQSGPGDPAADDARWEKYIGDLKEALAATDDPEARARIEEMLRGVTNASSTASFNEAVTQFNEAIELANKRDYPGAIALLEDLLPKVEAFNEIPDPARPEPTLKERILEMLERFRADAARLRQPIQ
jgi:hypothetical protein